MVMKIDQLVKTYKSDEKLLLVAIAKVGKEVVS
jgi:hypothetical protein